MTLLSRIQIRRGSETEWQSVEDTVILAFGEPAAVLDDKGAMRLKIGDGITIFRELPFVSGAGDEETYTTTYKSLRELLGEDDYDALTLDERREYSWEQLAAVMPVNTRLLFQMDGLGEFDPDPDSIWYGLTKNFDGESFADNLGQVEVTRGEIIRHTNDAHTPAIYSFTGTAGNARRYESYVFPTLCATTGENKRAWGAVANVNNLTERNTFTTIPDIANYDPENKITANGGTWTVPADVKFGYVRCGIQPNTPTHYVTIKKNGVSVSTGFGSTSGQVHDVMFMVKGGDVIQLSGASVNTNNNISPFTSDGVWFGCYFIPAKIIWATTPATEFHNRLIGQPDYANMETTNRISANNGEWTADRDGYVFVQGKILTTANGWWHVVTVRINCKIVASSTTSQINGQIAENRHYSDTFPVSKGDVVQLSINSDPYTMEFACYFIPPKAVAPMFVTEADLVSSDLPGEVSIDPVTKVMRVQNPINTFTVVPDYEKISERTPSITGNIGTWTVDEDGFVQVGTNGSAPGHGYTARINDSIVATSMLPSGGIYGGNLRSVHEVKIGDVVTVESTTSRLISFIPPRIVWASSDATKFNVNLIGQPDYARMESNSYVSTTTPVQITRDGYVYCQVSSNVANGTGNVVINGNTYIMGYIGSNTAIASGIYKVSAGDTVNLSVSGGTIGSTQIRFIPPKTVAPMFIEGADLQSGTLPGEITWNPETKVARVIPGAGGGGTEIDDSSVTLVSTWSSQKITEKLEECEGGVSEAPEDGKGYVRKDGDWSVSESVPAGGLAGQVLMKLSNVQDYAAQWRNLPVASGNVASGYWSLQRIGDFEWQGVAYGNGRFVAVSSDTTVKMLTSTDGANWTDEGLEFNIPSDQMPQTLSLRSVIFADGRFVAAGYNASIATNARILYSDDGLVWNVAGAGFNVSTSETTWHVRCHGNGLFVATGDFGTQSRIATSPDGVTWTRATNILQGTGSGWNQVAYGNGLFVATQRVITPGGGAAPVRMMMTSTDGMNWTESDFRSDRIDLCRFGAGKFVVMGLNTSGTPSLVSPECHVFTSPDGVNWTEHTAPRNRWNDIIYQDGLFVAVAGQPEAQEMRHIKSGRLMTSPDGETWTSHRVPFGNWNSICYGDGMYVAVASETRPDSYTPQPDETGQGFRAMAVRAPFGVSGGSCDCTGGGTYQEYNLTSQLDGVATVFDIDPSITNASSLVVYYGGQRLVADVNYTVDYAAHTITSLTTDPWDSDEGRNLIVVEISNIAGGGGGDSRVYVEDLSTAEQTSRIDELSPGDTVHYFDATSVGGVSPGSEVIFENSRLYCPSGQSNTITYVDKEGIEHPVVEHDGSFAMSRVPIDDVFVSVSGDEWDDVFVAVTSLSVSNYKRWDNKELLDAIRSIDSSSMPGGGDISGAITAHNASASAHSGLFNDYAPKNNPTFTGVPQAPTPALGTNTQQLATTAFVMASLASQGGTGSNGDATMALNMMRAMATQEAPLTINGSFWNRQGNADQILEHGIDGVSVSWTYRLNTTAGNNLASYLGQIPTRVLQMPSATFEGKGGVWNDDESWGQQSDHSIGGAVGSSALSQGGVILTWEWQESVGSGTDLEMSSSLELLANGDIVLKVNCEHVSNFDATVTAPQRLEGSLQFRLG